MLTICETCEGCKVSCGRCGGTGGERRICDACRGTGYVACRDCDGAGEVEVDEEPAAAAIRPIVKIDSRPAKQLPLLRGLNDCRGQLDLFPDMEIA